MPIVPAIPSTGFPAKQLSDMLSSWFDSKKNSPLAAPPVALPSGTSFDLQPELSSQQAVIVLINCKDVLGYRPSKKVIKKGGYANRAEFLTELVGALQTDWNTKHNINSFGATSKESYTHATI
jgi:hypothetical protein